MWPTSVDFSAALHGDSRRWFSRVEVLYGGQSATEFDVVLDGSVSLDDVAVRRACDLTLADVDGTLTPRDARDLLAPKGTELRIARGLQLADGTVEWIPLGVFGVSKPEVTADADGGTQISLAGHDRVDAIKLRRFAAPWVIAKNTPTTTAIAQIVTSRMDVPTRIVASGTVTPEVIYEELSDPWAAVAELAAADSLVAYFDPMGTLVIGPDEQIETGITYAPGPRSFLLGASRGMDSSQAYSGVIVTGEHPDETPIRVELWDTDPTSPTYHLGPFGRRPYGFASELITTVAMANKAAATILPRVRRIPQAATMTTVGHIGHEVGDVVVIDDPRTLTSGRWRIVGGTVQLRPGTTTWKLEEADA